MSPERNAASRALGLCPGVRFGQKLHRSLSSKCVTGAREVAAEICRCQWLRVGFIATQIVQTLTFNLNTKHRAARPPVPVTLTDFPGQFLIFTLLPQCPLCSPPKQQIFFFFPYTVKIQQHEAAGQAWCS